MNNITICLWNWADYNEGVASWKWFTLPADTEDMQEWIDHTIDDGKEEIFICDSEHRFIEESTSIEGLIELSFTAYDEILELATYEPVYGIDMLDEMLEGYSPTEIIDMLHYGHYSPLDDFFCFDGYGNIETLSDSEYDHRLTQSFNEGAREFLNDY